MDQLVDTLSSKLRLDVPTIGHLGKISKKDLSRILSRVDIDSDDYESSCWIWKHVHHQREKGHMHPSISFKNKHVKVHRLLYHNFMENVPEYTWSKETKQVNHKCSHVNDGLCVNPWHCYLGTPKNNMQDAIQDKTKNKPPSGELNWKAKLTDAQVNEIKTMKGTTHMSQKKIAIKYGVSQSQISRWWNNVTRGGV